MRSLKKLAAALAAAAMVTALAGCVKNENAPAQSAAPQSTTFESKSAPQSSEPQSAPVSSSEPEQSAPPMTILTDGLPENPSEASLKYYEDAEGIVDKYLSIVMGNMDEIEQLGLSDIDYDNPEDVKKIAQYIIDCAKKGECCLDELEELTPTEEMSAFHTGLVRLMRTMRGYSDIANSLENVDVTDEDTVDEFNERVLELLERFNAEYKAFYVKYPGFGKTLAEGEWRENTSWILHTVFEPDLGEDAERCAENISNALRSWLSKVNDKSALTNVTLEIINTKNGCEITGAALGDKDIEELEQGIYSFFPDNYQFWARVYLREDGSPSCTLYSSDGRLDDSELNGGAGLASNLREWRGTGVTSEGHIIGIFGAPPTSEPQ